MPEPNEITVMMEFFKKEDDETFESMEFDALNEEKYIIDDSIFDEPSEELEAVLEEESKPVFNMEQKSRSMDNYTYLRVLNASPGSPRIDVVYQKDNQEKFTLARNLGYARITDYRKVIDGLSKITIFHAARKNPIDSFKIDLPSCDGYYTLMLCGPINDLKPIISCDMSTSSSQKHASVRFINLSPDTGCVDLLLNNNVIFPDTAKETITKYADIKPDIYNLKLLGSSKKRLLLSGRNVIFKQNKAYTIYVLGLVYGYPGLAFAISLDGT